MTLWAVLAVVASLGIALSLVRSGRRRRGSIRGMLDASRPCAQRR